MSAASGESERPTPAVGQRWEAGGMYGNTPGIVAVVVAVAGGDVRYRYEDHPGLAEVCRGVLSRPLSSFVGCAGRYLGGPAVPQEGPGVRAGQRWRWNDGTHTIGKVSASGASCELHLASGQTHSEWPILGDRPAGALGLIADAPAPSVTPATPTADEAPLPVVGSRFVGERRDIGTGAALSCLQHIQARPKPEPYVCPVDEWDLLPGVDERGWR